MRKDKVFVIAREKYSGRKKFVCSSHLSRYNLVWLYRDHTNAQASMGLLKSTHVFKDWNRLYQSSLFSTSRNTNVKHFFASSLFSLISRFQNSNYQFIIISSDDNSAEMCDGWWLQLSCMRCKLCRGILRLFSSIYMGQVCEHTLRELSTHSYTCCIQYAMK